MVIHLFWMKINIHYIGTPLFHLSKINGFLSCIEQYPMDVIFDIIMHLDKIYNMNGLDRRTKPTFAGICRKMADWPKLDSSTD